MQKVNGEILTKNRQKSIFGKEELSKIKYKAHRNNNNKNKNNSNKNRENKNNKK